MRKSLLLTIGLVVCVLVTAASFAAGGKPGSTAPNAQETYGNKTCSNSHGRYRHRKTRAWVTVMADWPRVAFPC